MQMEVPFELFLGKAANILTIWETIIINLCVTDIANCLKVCKGLRWAIRQCLLTNSRLKLKLDQETMVSSLKKGWIQSKAMITFEGLTKDPDFYPTFTIDGTFVNRSSSTIVKLDSSGMPYNIPGPSGIQGFSQIFPTMEEDLVYAECGYGELALFKICPHEVKEIKYNIFADYPIGQEIIHEGPCCIRYRLFTSEENRKDCVIILMKPLYPSVTCSKVVPLYKVNKNETYSVFHVSSNEEVSFIKTNFKYYFHFELLNSLRTF